MQRGVVFGRARLARGVLPMNIRSSRYRSRKGSGATLGKGELQ